METRKRRLLLARHGETEWNSAFRFQGRTDVPLGERGLAQADLLALRLAKTGYMTERFHQGLVDIGRIRGIIY